MSFSDLLASTVSSAPHVLLESMPRVTTTKFEVLYYISNRNSEQIAVVRVHLDNSSNKIMESATQESHNLVCFFLFTVHMFFRPPQTLEILSISLFRKTFCMLKNFCARRELAEVLQQNINSEFLCIISLRQKVSIVPFGLTKAPETFQLLIFILTQKTLFYFVC